MFKMLQETKTKEEGSERMRDFCNDECEEKGICPSCPNILEVTDVASEDNVTTVRLFDNIPKKYWAFISRNKYFQTMFFEKIQAGERK